MSKTVMWVLGIVVVAVAAFVFLPKLLAPKKAAAKSAGAGAGSPIGQYAGAAVQLAKTFGLDSFAQDGMTALGEWAFGDSN